MHDQANGGGSEKAASAGAEAATDVAANENAQPPAEEKPSPETEINRLRDQLLRTAADFDNFRKRSRREAEDAQRRGRESAIKDLLPVFDNLERAASHAEGSEGTKSVADGLRMVLKQFNDTLEKMGIKRVPTVGIPFDPAVHEAIQHMASPDHASGLIMAEVQAGYSLGDHLIRAAMVVVSKGPPAGAAPSEGTSGLN
jgi:molecular chaperone GrpE